MVKLLDKFFSRFRCDLGIDLGTANTLVFAQGHGVIIQEPSVVALDSQRNLVLAVGDEAKRMIGRTPGNVVAVRPLRDGVIADFDITETMLKYFIKKAMTKNSIFKPRIIVGVPSGITSVEKRAVQDATYHAGAKEAYLIEEPMAAAIGADLPVSDPAGSMIIDIGGGTTEIAVISLGGIVVSKSIRVAGDELDEAIISYCRETYRLLIGERTAEDIKIHLGSAAKMEEEQTMEIRGRDLVSGLPKTFTLTSQEVRGAFKGYRSNNCRWDTRNTGKNTARTISRHNGSRDNLSWRWGLFKRARQTHTSRNKYQSKNSKITARSSGAWNRSCFRRN